MTHNDLLDARSILGTGGTIARRLPNFEHRPQQLDMAEAVNRAIGDKKHLVVEAGTGVGKSFGYLVPAILAVTDDSNSERPRRIIVSTHTISLQEQLLTKDIPFLNSVIPREFSCVLGKGRRNYLSLRRLELAQRRALGLFAQDELITELDTIVAWAKRTDDGSQSDLERLPSPIVWDEVASDHGNCMGRKCPTYQTCFYYTARRRMQHAQLLIVNHALFLTDLAIRSERKGFLPDYDVVIFDEAHTVPHAAREHLGLAIRSGQIEYALSRLYNERTHRGLLVYRDWREGQHAVLETRQAAAHFFQELEHWSHRQSGDNGRVRVPDIVANPLSPALKNLSSQVLAFGRTCEDESERQDFLSVGHRLDHIADDIAGWLRQDHADAVYWLEKSRSRRGQMRIELRGAPIDVGPTLRSLLFDKVPTVIMTSATLAVGRDANFQYFQRMCGITNCRTQTLGSPFDYQRQVELAIVKGMPDPSADAEAYTRLCCEVIRRYVERFEGRTFALFTSYKMLRDVATRLTGWLTTHDYKLYSQADGTPRHVLLQSFRADPRGVLLGTDSFWQGVDVPGDALKCVIITRLPFSVPDHPLLQAQLEFIRQHGGNPFMDYQVPEAIIRLRQGFGRLVRSREDTGTVVLLDPRIVTKRYGWLFVESLPECTMVEDYAVGGGLE